MQISKATPYEVLDDVEVRVFQSKSSAAGDAEFLAQGTRELFADSEPLLTPSNAPSRVGSAAFRAELRLPDGDSVSCQLPEPPSGELIQPGDPRAYGSALYAWLFRDDIKEAFTAARSIAEGSDPSADFGGNLRLRLWLDPRSEKLHSLWWETLHDPERDQPLSTTMAFSRFMRVRSSRSKPIRERPLRMLLIASNPEGLSDLDLADINVQLEKTIFMQATERLSGALDVDHQLRPTVRRIRQAQSESGYHLVHLLAHAVVRDGRKSVILADEAGHGHEVESEEVVEALVGGGKRPPRVAFLATPLSGEEQAGRTLVGIAPQLVDAGVQAAVAIQSSISEDRLRRFCSRFYEVLIGTGIVDVAVAAARAEVYEADSWEWAYPVLYTGTPDAKLFHILPEYIKGFAVSM